MGPSNAITFRSILPAVVFIVALNLSYLVLKGPIRNTILAYDHHNHLPSCQTCNRLAKKNHFPITGVRAYKPGDSLEDEEPLLRTPVSQATFRVEVYQQ